MPFWSGETLAARLPNLIEGFDPDKIDCAAYTLRIGREVYISPSTAADAATRTKTVLDERQDFGIPPGQFAFLLTEERVTVPNSSVAFISMKARIKFKGLVNVSGFHVDPGYRGRLVFGVYNAGPAVVHLARGDDCFLIWYASLDRESEQYSRKDPSFDEISSDLITPIAGQLQSLAGLSDRIAGVETEQQVARVRVSVATTLLITLVVLWIALLAQSCRATTNLSGASPMNTSPAVTPPSTEAPNSSLPENPTVATEPLP